MRQLAAVLPGAGGCSPSLTKDLVMFTDNQDTGKSYCGGYENRRTGCEYACYR